jgi:hypothetical protein
VIQYNRVNSHQPLSCFPHQQRISSLDHAFEDRPLLDLAFDSPACSQDSFHRLPTPATSRTSFAASRQRQNSADAIPFLAANALVFMFCHWGGQETCPVLRSRFQGGHTFALAFAARPGGYPAPPAVDVPPMAQTEAGPACCAGIAAGGAGVAKEPRYRST